MYVYTNIHIHVYAYICLYIYTWTNTCLHICTDLALYRAHDVTSHYVLANKPSKYRLLSKKRHKVSLFERGLFGKRAL